MAKATTKPKTPRSKKPATQEAPASRRPRPQSPDRTGK